MLADLGLLYCALFWGLSFASMKILVGVYPSCWLLFLRFGTASVMMCIFFFRRILSSWRETLKSGIILGTLLFIAIATQTIALPYISAGRSAFISATYVLMVPLILWAFRKIFPGWITLIAACLCVSGMYFLSRDDMSGGFGWGDVLTFVCAFTFAVQVIAISRYTKDEDPIVLSFVEFATLAVCAFVSSLVFESHTEFISMKGLPELLFTIIFCTFGCYMIQICAQKYADPSHATIIMSLESVFGLISGIIFLGESLSLNMAIGCALIFIAVMMSELQPYMHRRA